MKLSVACCGVLFIFPVILAHGSAQEIDWEARLEDTCEKSDIVVLGQLTAVDAKKGLADGGGLAGSLSVVRYIKGHRLAKDLSVVVEFMRPHTAMHWREKGIWFIRKPRENVESLIAFQTWAASSEPRVIESLARVDRVTRIPGIPKRAPEGTPVTLAIGARGDRGEAVLRKEISRHSPFMIEVHLENHTSDRQTVMPPLDGSLIKKRYPHYGIEIRDEDQNVVPLIDVSCCGNITAFRKRDFIHLGPSEVMRAQVRVFPRQLPRIGTYRLRLHYSALRDLRLGGRGLAGREHPSVKEAMSQVWEGRLVSNWVTIVVK